MKYNNRVVKLPIVVSALCMGTMTLAQYQTVPMGGIPLVGMVTPKEKFQVIVKRVPDSQGNKIDPFYYAFAKAGQHQPTFVLSQESKAKFFSLKIQNSKSVSSGFLTLLASDIKTPSLNEETIYLLVSKDKKALIARLKENRTLSDPTSQVFVSESVLRFPLNAKCPRFSPSQQPSDFTIRGKITFTVKPNLSKPQQMEVDIKDDRTCNKTVQSTRSWSEKATSAWESTKTGAHSAWDSTKKAAGSASKSISGAASRAKTSIGNAAARAKTAVKNRFSTESKSE